MTLEQLGYTAQLEQFRKDNQLEDLDVARVIAEHRESYVVRSEKSEYHAEIIGNLRYNAQNRSDLPAVGDWVSIMEYDKDKAMIHKVFPRTSILERRAIAKGDDNQIIATNIDFAFIVQAVDRDFSINRIERYLTICNSSGVSPIIILSKVDLVNDSTRKELIDSVKSRIKDHPIFPVSNETKYGIDNLESVIHKSKTYCLLGSSGVGKSSLLNTLAGNQSMKTDTISSHTGRGKHVTTHRELHLLKSGAILIDNPGMREVGIADFSEGLDITFNKIIELSEDCKFKDCKHINESGCAVLEALENGELNLSSYDNYQKMEREKDHYELSTFEKRQKDKGFGKMVRQVKKDIGSFNK